MTLRVTITLIAEEILLSLSFSKDFGGVDFDC